jgi:hypothetical protein
MSPKVARGEADITRRIRIVVFNDVQLCPNPVGRAAGLPRIHRTAIMPDAGLIRGMQADREEDRFGAVRGECGKHRLSVLRPGPIVEGQHHLTFAKEIMALEVCSNPKPGPPVVSISTTRLIPRALGLPAHEDTASTGATAGGGASAVITAEARPSVGAAWAGKDARPETKAFCKIAPKTATHKTIASPDAIAARRIRLTPQRRPGIRP